MQNFQVWIYCGRSYARAGPTYAIRYQPSAQGGEEGKGEEGSAVQVTLADGTEIQGDAVLVTVPLDVLKKSMLLSSFFCTCASGNNYS